MTARKRRHSEIKMPLFSKKPQSCVVCVTVTWPVWATARADSTTGDLLLRG